MAPALRLLLLISLGSSPFSAICQAQSFDCGKAQTAIEMAICASPALIAQDSALAASYRQALAVLAGEAAKLDDLRQKQRRWVTDRNKSCSAKDQTRLSKCLGDVYRTRLAALETIVSSASVSAPAAAPPAVPTPEAAPQVSAAASPATPAPALAAQSAPDVSSPSLSAPAHTSPLKPLPPLGPQPRLMLDHLPADQDGGTLMTVDTPGHIAIRTQSTTGTALQLVDMISGPGTRMGAPGASDGRVDALLDKGTYKIRVFGTKGAQGEVKLTAQARRELEQPAGNLLPERPISAELNDLQQRSYWIDVPQSGRVRLEAVGRSLQDLRLWREGTDIVDLSPSISIFESKPGLPMTRALLAGTVEPGRYLVTAYGGEKLTWANADEAEPFHIRTGTQMSLAAGIAEGVIGPFGSVEFEAPADFNTFRLDLPQAAPVELRAGRISDTGTVQRAAVDKTSREPVAVVSLSGGNGASLVEVSGFEGQRFRLRGLDYGYDTRFDGSVPHLVSLDIAGEGGDEIPATALLERYDSEGKASIIASDMPRLGPGQAWRRRFNLRGPTSLLFEMTAPGPISIRAGGPAIRADVSPVLVGSAPRADGRNPGHFDLDAGYYLLRVAPDNNAGGIVDLVFGPPGLVPDVQPGAAARTTLSFGVQEAGKATSYQIISNTAPGLLTGPRVVALPADLEAHPLTLWQESVASTQPATPGQSPQSGSLPQLSDAPMPAPMPQDAPADGPGAASQPESSADLRIDVHVPQGGTITAIDMHNNPVAFAASNERIDDKGRTLSLRLPAPSAPRAIGISWQPDAAAAEQKAPSPPPAPLIAGKPQFLDLAEDAHKSFRLEVAEGGLYRVETLGRLQTSLGLGTSFLPKLGTASDNGDGHNALLQSYLRAGSYRIDVSVQKSSGHLGIAATPASLLAAAALVPNGDTRGALSGGQGAIVPIEIASAGSYQLDLYALGNDLVARLEDAEGWPLTAPGPLSSLTQDFTPGHYRLVILPREVDTRFVARLRPVVDAPLLQGHGPHPLTFNQAQSFQWREPQSKSDARVHDSWTFDLAGDADVGIDLTEGMIGTLTRDDKEQIAKFVADPKFSGTLKAGHYRVDLTSLAHDDRLDYEITLDTAALQPGEARFVDLPAELSFNLAQDRVISLTSFGRREVKGVLKDAQGTVIERLAGRPDDWNIALSRRLSAGSYVLTLDQAAAAGRANKQSDDSSDNQASDSSGNDSKLELRFALPQESPQPALTLQNVGNISGTSVSTFPLPADVKDRLSVVTARSTAELVLSVEKRAADGSWAPQAFARGRTPVIAWPAAGGDAAEWRASVWTLDGSAAPIGIAARSIVEDMREPGTVSLDPVTIDGLNLTLHVALVHAPSAGLVQLDGTSEILAGASIGRPLTTATAGLFSPQSDRLWLVAQADGQVAVTPTRPSAEIALTLAPGDRATVPAAAPAPGKIRLWRAESAFGQPGLGAGRGMGVSRNSAVALAGVDDLRVWNAGDDDSLQLRLAPLDITKLDALTLDDTYIGAVPAFSAQPVKLPAGVKRLILDLAPGLAVVSAPADPQILNVWSGTRSLSRSSVTSADEIWLVNATDHPTSGRLALSPGNATPLISDEIRRRFFGTVGSEEIAVDAVKGDVLKISGGAATFTGDDGKILRGESLDLPGAGTAIIDHQAGLVALWLERGGKSAWPTPEPTNLALPQNVKLDGPAMAFRLNPAQPLVLDISTDAPVIIALEQNGHRDLQLFPNGAEFHRYVAAGSAVLTLYSTHDGPLSGSMNATATQVVTIGEGVGTSVVLAPGTTALFGFEVKQAGNIGVGLRSDPDKAIARLLDARGQSLGEGINQLKQLKPGSYLLEARAPADAPALVVRPAVIGLSPPPAGPPSEVAEDYLQRAGLKPTGSK